MNKTATAPLEEPIKLTDGFIPELMGSLSNSQQYPRSLLRLGAPISGTDRVHFMDLIAGAQSFLIN